MTRATNDSATVGALVVSTSAKAASASTAPTRQRFVRPARRRGSPAAAAVRSTWRSNSRSATSLTQQPALRIRTVPSTNTASRCQPGKPSAAIHSADSVGHSSSSQPAGRFQRIRSRYSARRFTPFHQCAAEARFQVREQRAQRLRLAARPAGPAARCRSRRRGRCAASRSRRARSRSRKQRGVDRAAQRVAAGVDDVGDVALDAAVVVAPQRQVPQRIVQREAAVDQLARQRPCRRQNSAGNCWPERDARGAGQRGHVDHQRRACLRRRRPARRTGSRGLRHRCCRSRCAGRCAS